MPDYLEAGDSKSPHAGEFELKNQVDKKITKRYSIHMKVFKWDYAKNARIIEERGVSFEEIVLAVNEGKALDLLTHPNQEKYPGQEIYVVEYKDYCYLVPCKN